jgi:hypothetical protein
MDARIMRTLAELIAEHHRQKYQDRTTDQYTDFDTTVSHDETIEDKENPHNRDSNHQAMYLGTATDS